MQHSKWQSWLTPALRAFALRFLIVLLLLTLTRIIFYVNNSGAFHGIGAGEWLAGMWFDAVTCSLVFLPFFTLSLLPVRMRSKAIYRFIQRLTFVLPVLAMLALNLLDTEYFHFTQKRSTADLFATFSSGNDVGQLLTTFIKDFWFLILCFVVLAIAVLWIYRKTDSRRFTGNQAPDWKKEGIVFVGVLAILVIVGRGGLSYKPLTIIDATLYTEPQNTALVLNSAFTMIKSYGKDDLSEKDYLPEKTEERLFNPIHSTQPQHILPDGTNVVLIMLESFGNEWVGAFNDTTSYTPFLDSLIGESWSFRHGFANGKKSIEAVPTIIASLPSLMDNPYISSAYSNNAINTLPNILKKKGYSSAFYHGATNGSMRFNSFAKLAGFDQYVGRHEYNNDKHFDKTWGIMDEYFNPWTARQLTKMKGPFFATLFTLSSHHPYHIPPNWKGKLKKGPYPVCESINYADESLRLFFKQARREPWFKNTLFVLVADHSPSTENEFYSQRTQLYKIPIVFYHPGGKLPKRMEPAIFQQLDIMPTILDLINVDTKYYAYGNSWFSKEKREAITYLEGTYCYFRDSEMLAFSNDEPVSLLNFTLTRFDEHELLRKKKLQSRQMERRLKAIIQRYNRDLIHNQTTVR